MMFTINTNFLTGTGEVLLLNLAKGADGGSFFVLVANTAATTLTKQRRVRPFRDELVRLGSIEGKMKGYKSLPVMFASGCLRTVKGCADQRQ